MIKDKDSSVEWLESFKILLYSPEPFITVIHNLTYKNNLLF